MLVAAKPDRSAGQDPSADDAITAGDIRRFEADYKVRPVLLVENYRSTMNIINAANRVIAPAVERMKAGHDIVVNRNRKKEPAGGTLEQVDSVGRGRVQIVKKATSPLEQAALAVKELQRLSKVVPDWDWTRAAVIAREWRYLQPVRSYCEARGVPVQAANSDPPNFWRLRETQTLINWLKDRKSATVRTGDLTEWIERQQVGPWWSMLKEGMDEFTEELGDRETDRKAVIEWFAEWGRDARKRQSGLLLLTAHRAKGLEFDDVVILDGGWDRRSLGEDRDAARRLYYVAMTRARRSLALILMTNRHPIIDGLDDPSVLIRAKSQDNLDATDCKRIYQTLNPSEVNLDFAGRIAGDSETLMAIERLNAGDLLTLKDVEGPWFVFDQNDVRVGRLANKFKPPEGTRFVAGRLFATSTRFRTDSGDAYQAQLKRDQWNVVLPNWFLNAEPRPVDIRIPIRARELA